MTEYIETLFKIYQNTGDDIYLKRINAVCNAHEVQNLGIYGDWQKKASDQNA